MFKGIFCFFRGAHPKETSLSSSLLHFSFSLNPKLPMVEVTMVRFASFVIVVSSSSSSSGVGNLRFKEVEDCFLVLLLDDDNAVGRLQGSTNSIILAGEVIGNRKAAAAREQVLR